MFIGQKHSWKLIAFALVFLFAGVGTAQAQDAEGTFHLCLSPGPCPVDHDPSFGVVTTTDTTPTVQIVRSPNTGSFDHLVFAFFVPTSAGTPVITATWDDGGVLAATYVGVGSWTSGFLFGPNATPGGFLNFAQTGGPASPIDAFLPATELALDTSVSGYNVALIDVGFVSFPTSTSEVLQLITSLPVGTVVYAFATDVSPFACNGTCVTVLDSTAPSGSIVVVPEPSTLLLLSTGLIAVGLLRRKIQLRP